MLLRLQAAFLLLIAPFAIRSRYRQRFLNPSLAAPRATDREIVTAMRDALHWHPFRFTCLERAGAFHRLMHSHGVASILRIGVKPAISGPGIAAHAWVEFPEGHPLLDDEHHSFGVLRPSGPTAPTNPK